MTKRKIIIDTDPGIDDTYAIIAALNYSGFDVLGVVNLMNADCLVYPGATGSLRQTQLTLDDLFFLKKECGDVGQLFSEMAEHYQDMYWKFIKQTGVIIHDLVTVMTAIDPTLTDAFDRLTSRWKQTGFVKARPSSKST